MRDNPDTPRPASSDTRIDPARPKVDPWDPNCPSREIVDILASKWVMLIIPLLLQAPKRNAELLRGVAGISQKMLTQTLRSLEHRNIVARHDFQEIPPRVEYSLTPLGRSLADILVSLDEWVIAHYDEMIANEKSRP